MQLLVNFSKVIILVFVLLLHGCYTQTQLKQELYSELKLYDLSKATKMTFEIDDIRNGNGQIFGELESGEKIEGEFSLIGPVRSRPSYPNHIEHNSLTIKKFINKKVGEDGQKKEYSEDFIKKSFPELYGFSKNSQISPMGNGVILSENKLVIELIFYKIDFQRRIGDGIAKDNKGNIYRVYIASEYLYQ